MKIFSSGGGVQSTAVLVLSAQGIIDFPVHVFSNVGDRAESPETIAYVRDVLKPYAEKNGVKWIEVCKRNRYGEPIDLLTKTEDPGRSVPLPVRMAGSGAPGNRSCTVDWKIKPVAGYLLSLIPSEIRKQVESETRSELKVSGAEIKREVETLRQYADPKKPWVEAKALKKAKAIVRLRIQSKLYLSAFPISLGKGISTDEAQRAKPETGFSHYQAKYPLIDLSLSRVDCAEIIRKAGLPMAPKSSCWFCPYKNMNSWQQLRESNPKLFQDAVDLEKLLYQRSVDLGRGGVTSHLREHLGKCFSMRQHRLIISKTYSMASTIRNVNRVTAGLD